mmetsp:Transcript_52888/g.123784  ORF Transcript_52888/g.123784 Transcript_52888/m.123784 type:complete len:120 (+) Transcript_52888:360-719(+)
MPDARFSRWVQRHVQVWAATEQGWLTASSCGHWAPHLLQWKVTQTGKMPFLLRGSIRDCLASNFAATTSDRQLLPVGAQLEPTSLLAAVVSLPTPGVVLKVMAMELAHSLTTAPPGDIH